MLISKMPNSCRSISGRPQVSLQVMVCINWERPQTKFLLLDAITLAPMALPRVVTSLVGMAQQLRLAQMGGLTSESTFLRTQVDG